MMETPRSFRAFWPHYLMAHRNPLCRRMHFVGTTGAFIGLLTAIYRVNFWWFLLGVFFAYVMAWVGHFQIERNRPATFGNPLWSLMGDIRMYLLWLSGGLEKALSAVELESAERHRASKSIL